MKVEREFPMSVGRKASFSILQLWCSRYLLRFEVRLSQITDHGGSICIFEIEPAKCSDLYMTSF